MEPLLAFAAALVALRLAARIAARWRERRRPELLAWSASLVAYAAASGALAWGSAAGWNGASFRLYYLFGALLTAPLLGAGSLLLSGRRWAAPLALAYVGFAVGAVVAEPLAAPVGGVAIPEAQAHLDYLPLRVTAIVASTAGTLAVIVVAAATFRRRPIGNLLIVAGVATAAVGSALLGLGVAQTAVSLAVAAVLLYAGFVSDNGRRGVGGAGAAAVAPHEQPAGDEHDQREEVDEPVSGVRERHA